MARRLLDDLNKLREMLKGMSRIPEPQETGAELPEPAGIDEVRQRVRKLAQELGYGSLREAASSLGVEWDGTEEAWRELLAALEEEAAARGAGEEQVEQA